MSGSGKGRGLFARPASLSVPLSPLSGPASAAPAQALRLPTSTLTPEHAAATAEAAVAEAAATAEAVAATEAVATTEELAAATAEPAAAGFDPEEPTAWGPARELSPPEEEGDPHTPLAPGRPPSLEAFDEPRLIEEPARAPQPTEEDEEPTLHEWSRPDLHEPAEPDGEAEAAVEPEPAVVEPEPAALEPEAIEPEAIGEVEQMGDDDPRLPRNRPVAPVRRRLDPNRFGGANPAGGAPSAPAGSVLPSAPPPPPPVVMPVIPSPTPAAAERTEVSASAPGKVILLGEHAVVFGHRAIAAAVSLATTVTVYRRPGPSRVEETSIRDDRLAAALASVVPADGTGVRIQSTLPAGCGMGSSAALAIAVVRALARLEGREASLRELVDRGFALERVFHGNPSGLDHTVSASGGALLFRKGSPAEELRIGQPLRLVIANTGTPSNTAQMVESVRRRNPTELIMRLGALVEMAAASIPRGDPIGGYFTDAHRCLRLIGVSTPELDELCRSMEAAGSTGAKLSGAGGGGIAIALVDARTEDAVRRAAETLARGGVYVAEIAATLPRA